MPALTHCRQRGFTLVEMAVVMLILTLLAGGLTTGLSAHLTRRAEAATDDALAEARDALLGHVMRKGSLPCPAKSPTDGTEDRVDATTCRRTTGLLPWATLGISGLDGWSHRLRYAVSETYAQPIRDNVSGDMTRFPAGTIEVHTRNLDGTELTLTTGDGRTPVVILSHGANGLGAVDQQGNALAAPPAGTDEAFNAAAVTRLFISRQPSDNPEAPGGRFDDRVTWLSPNLIAHRLINAGQLP